MSADVLAEILAANVSFMPLKLFLQRVTGLPYILHVAFLAVNAVYKVVARASDVRFAREFFARIGALNLA